MEGCIKEYFYKSKWVSKIHHELEVFINSNKLCRILHI